MEEVNIFYGLNGKPLEDSKGAYARQSEKSFYVMEFCGQLFKKGTVVRKMEADRLKWRKVGTLCFHNYLKYLETNKEPNYLVANRNPQE